MDPHLLAKIAPYLYPVFLTLGLLGITLGMAFRDVRWIFIFGGTLLFAPPLPYFQQWLPLVPILGVFLWMVPQRLLPWRRGIRFLAILGICVGMMMAYHRYHPFINLNFLLLDLLLGFFALWRIFHQKEIQSLGILGYALSIGLGWQVQAQEGYLGLLLIAGEVTLLIGMVLGFYRLAYEDALTGIPSRRRLEEYLPTLSPPYTIVMVDVDHFKKVNDRYGHDVGDQVLKKVSSFLLSLSPLAKVFRYGGEEFGVIFPGKEKKEVYPHVETLRKTIAQKPFYVRGSSVSFKVTISMGIAQSDAQLSPWEVLKKADKALYRAKKAGRNCIKG